MKSQNTKSSEELKKEVDKDLRNVRRDIDDIQGRLTPGQFIDDAIFHGGSPAATFDHLKRNPVGTTFLSLGTLLLMEDENHLTYETAARSKISSARTTASSKISSLKEEIKSHMPHKDLSSGTAPSLGDIARSKISHVKDSIQSKVSGMREGIEAKIPTEAEIRETFLSGEESNAEGYAGMESSGTSRLKAAREKLTSGFSQGKEKLSSGLTQSKEKLSAGLETGKEKFKNMDNTTFMALGAGLGVLTGASLPVSEAEERLVGEKFQGRLSDFNHDLREAMNECSNILKDLVISDVKNLNVKMF